MKKKLTVKGVERIKPPSSGRLEVFDTLLPGFGLRVSDTGRKSWFVMYRLHGKQVRQTLGTYPKVELDEARSRARDVLKAADKGQDPRKPERARKVRTFAWVAEKFMEDYAKKHNKTWKKVESHLKALSDWDNRMITDITRLDIVDELDSLKDRPYLANRTLATIRRLFNWCLEKGYVEASVVAGIKPPGVETMRQRVLDHGEIKALWKAAESLPYPVGPWFKLLMLTGQRSGEVARIQKADIRDGDWIQSDSKSGRKHLVPLSELAIDVVDSLPKFTDSYLFSTTGGKRPISGFTKIKAAIEGRLESDLGDWRFHDVRRTVYTELSRLKVEPHIKERVFNHSYGGRVEKTYDVWSYADEKREALQKWADELRVITSENVTVLEVHRAG